MGWTLFYMLVILKIPIVALLALVWWAVSQTTDAADDGDPREPLRRDPDHPLPRKPGPPRRGPHADPPPSTPRRVRARGKRIERTHG